MRLLKAKEVAAERNGWVPLQFANPSNPAVHAATTGQEILEDFGAEGLDAFCCWYWYWWYYFRCFKNP